MTPTNETFYEDVELDASEPVKQDFYEEVNFEDELPAITPKSDVQEFQEAVIKPIPKKLAKQPVMIGGHFGDEKKAPKEIKVTPEVQADVDLEQILKSQKKYKTLDDFTKNGLPDVNAYNNYLATEDTSQFAQRKADAKAKKDAEKGGYLAEVEKLKKGEFSSLDPKKLIGSLETYGVKPSDGTLSALKKFTDQQARSLPERGKKLESLVLASESAVADVEKTKQKYPGLPDVIKELEILSNKHDSETDPAKQNEIARQFNELRKNNAEALLSVQKSEEAATAIFAQATAMQKDIKSDMDQLQGLDSYYEKNNYFYDKSLSFTDNLKSMAHSLNKAADLGFANILRHADAISKMIAGVTPLESSGAFGKLADKIQASVVARNEGRHETETVATKVSEGAGGLPPMFAELALTPEFKIGKVAVPAFVTYMGYTSALDKFNERVDELEKQGVDYTKLPIVGGKVERNTDIEKSEIPEGSRGLGQIDILKEAGKSGAIGVGQGVILHALTMGASRYGGSLPARAVLSGGAFAGYEAVKEKIQGHELNDKDLIASFIMGAGLQAGGEVKAKMEGKPSPGQATEEKLKAEAQQADVNAQDKLLNAWMEVKPEAKEQLQKIVDMPESPEKAQKLKDYRENTLNDIPEKFKADIFESLEIKEEAKQEVEEFEKTKPKGLDIWNRLVNRYQVKKDVQGLKDLVRDAQNVEATPEELSEIRKIMEDNWTDFIGMKSDGEKQAWIDGVFGKGNARLMEVMSKMNSRQRALLLNKMVNGEGAKFDVSLKEKVMQVITGKALKDIYGFNYNKPAANPGRAFWTSSRETIRNVLSNENMAPALERAEDLRIAAEPTETDPAEAPSPSENQEEVFTPEDVRQQQRLAAQMIEGVVAINKEASNIAANPDYYITLIKNDDTISPDDKEMFYKMVDDAVQNKGALGAQAAQITKELGDLQMELESVSGPSALAVEAQTKVIQDKIENKTKELRDLYANFKTSKERADEIAEEEKAAAEEEAKLAEEKRKEAEKQAEIAENEAKEEEVEEIEEVSEEVEVSSEMEPTVSKMDKTEGPGVKYASLYLASPEKKSDYISRLRDYTVSILNGANFGERKDDYLNRNPIAKERIDDARKIIEWIEADNKEAIIEYLKNAPDAEEVNFNPYKKKPNQAPVEAKPEDAKGFVQMPIKNLTTDLEAFQGRGEKYSKQTFDRIVTEAQSGALNKSAIPPVQIWRNENGNWVILAGHSRTGAFEHLAKGEEQLHEKFKPSDFESINAQIVEADTLEEAQKIAQESNQGAVQTPSENAKYVRTQLLDKFKGKELETKLKNLYGAAHKRIRAYAHLNPSGKAMDALKAFEHATESKSDDGVKSISQWTGEARERFPELTNAHEDEIFDYLKGQDKLKNANEFMNLLNRRVNGLEVFNPKEPLNFEHRVGYGSNETEYIKSIAELEGEQTRLRKEIKKVTEGTLPREEKQRKINELQKNVLDNEDKLAELGKKRVQAAEGDKQQISIFDQISEQIQETFSVPKKKAKFKDIEGLDDDIDEFLGAKEDEELDMSPERMAKGQKMVKRFLDNDITSFGDMMEYVHEKYGPTIAEQLFEPIKFVYGGMKLTGSKDQKAKMTTGLAELESFTFDKFKDHVSSTNRTVESDSSGTIKESVGKDKVSDESGSIRNPDEAGRGGVDEGADPAQDNSSTSTGTPVIIGTHGHTELFRQEQLQGIDADIPGGELGKAGSGVDAEGYEAEQSGSGDTDEGFDDRNEKELVAKKKEQDKAESVPYERGLENIQKSLPFLLPHQHENIAKAEARFFDQKEKGFGIFDGTGTGKGLTGLGIAKRFIQQGKKNVLIVAPSDKKVADWVEEAAFLNMKAKGLKNTKDGKQGGVVVTTYANMRQNEAIAKVKWDLVLYDEAHNLNSNEKGANTGAEKAHRQLTGAPEVVKEKVEQEYPLVPASSRIAVEENAAIKKIREEKIAEELQNTKVVFLTATPFAWHKNLYYADGYLFHMGEKSAEGGYNSGSDKEKFFMSNFGYRMRYNKLTVPESGVDVGLMERNFHENLKKGGAITASRPQPDKDYERAFLLVGNTAAGKLGAEMDRGLDILYTQKPYENLREAVRRKWNYLYTQRLLEAIKAKEIVPIVEQAVDNGEKVVIFHKYNEGITSHPFDFSDPMLYMGMQESAQHKALEQWRNFQSDHPELVNLDVSGIQNPIKTFQEAFLDNVLMFNGNTSKKVRRNNVELFNDPKSRKDIIVVNLAAGEAGLNLHDKVGDKPRVMFQLGLPTRPTSAIQTEGRIDRYGMQSDAKFTYPVLHFNYEKWAFGDINNRSRTVENLAMGESARNLETSFKDGYINPVEEYGQITGKGGREADKNMEVMDEFEKAKTYYFGKQKKTSKTKSFEGVDYFATPEPLGYKMVKWLDSKPNDALLEPSAGHGAIGRFFPGDTKNKFIEPSQSLNADLSVVISGGDVIRDTFENHHIVNKYDGIAMNPPFGFAGKTALDHISKAFDHLQDGGRIVAIVPRGAFDGKFDKWLKEKDFKGRFLHPSAQVVQRILLPSVTFERAGTGVSAQVLIIDKNGDLEKPTRDLNEVDELDLTTDLSNLKSINELFDTIKDMNAPPRNEKFAVKENIDEFKDVTDPMAVMDTFNHSKTGKPLQVVKLTAYIGPGKFAEYKSMAKTLGGYWSSFKGGGAIPGFIMPTEEAARKLRDQILKDQGTVNEPQETYGKSPVTASKLSLKGYTVNDKQGEITTPTGEIITGDDVAEYSEGLVPEGNPLGELPEEDLKQVLKYFHVKEDTLPLRNEVQGQQPIDQTGSDSGSGNRVSPALEEHARKQHESIAYGEKTQLQAIEEVKLPEIKFSDGTTLRRSNLIKDFRENNQIVVGDYTFKPATFALDVANLFAQVRSPLIEKMAVMYYNDKGQVVDAELHTLGMPNVTSLGPVTEASEIKAQMTRLINQTIKLGAKGFAIAHNHPSGNIKPSHADVLFTRQVGTIVQAANTAGFNVEFGGHLVSDSDKFTFLKTFDGGIEEEQHSYQAQNFHFNDYPTLARKDDPNAPFPDGKMLEYAKQITEGGYSRAIVFLNPKMALLGYDMVPNKLSDFRTKIPARMKELGATKYVVISDKSPASYSTLQALFPGGMLDYISVINGDAVSHEYTLPQEMDYSNYSRLQEDAEPYRPELPQDVKEKTLDNLAILAKELHKKGLAGEDLAEALKDHLRELGVGHIAYLVNEMDLPGAKAKEMPSKTGSFASTDQGVTTGPGSGKAFNLFDKVKEVFAKYNVPINEGSLRKRYAGVYKYFTQGVRVQSMWNLFVAAHEMTHALDNRFKTSDNIQKNKALHKDLINELKDAYESLYPAPKKSADLNERIMEGFAMAVQYFLADRNYILTNYPNIVNEILHPSGRYYQKELHDFMNDMEQVVNEYHSLTPQDKVGARIKWMGTDKRRGLGFFKKLQINLFNDLQTGVDIDEKMGGKYRAKAIMPNAVMFRNAFSIASNWLHHPFGIAAKPQTYLGFGNWGDTRSGKRVMDYLKDLKEPTKLVEFNELLIARRQYYDYQRIDDLEAIIQAQTTGDPDIDAGNDVLQEAIEEHKRLSSIVERNDLPRVVAEGTMNNLSTAYEKQLEIFDAINSDLLDLLVAVGRLSDEKADEFRSRKGYASFQRYLDDEYLADVDGLGVSSQVKSLLKRVGSDLQYLPPVYSQMLAINEALLKGTHNLVLQAWANAAQNNIEVGRLFEAVSPQEAKKGDDFVKVMMDGKEKWYKTSPEFREFAEALSPGQVEMFSTAMRAAARVFKTGTTLAYPIFPLINLPVDAVTRIAFTKTGLIPGYHDIRTLGQMAVGFVDWLGIISRETEMQKYISQGGGQALDINAQSLEPQGAIDAMINKSKTRKALHVAELALDVLSLPSNLSEYMGRGSEYIRAIKQGHPSNVAMLMAAEVALNFSSKGKMGGKMGSEGVRWVAYMNVGFQALGQTIDQAKKNPARVGSVIALLTTLGITASLITYMFGNEDEKEQLADQPPSELARWIYIPNSVLGMEESGFVKLRIPENFGSGLGMAQLYMAHHYKDKPLMFKEFAQAGETILPQQTRPTQGIFGNLTAALPTAISPSVQIATNTKFYPQFMPLVPKSLSNKLPKDQYNKYSSETAKAVGKALNMSPIMIDFWVRNQFGRSTALVQSMAESAVTGNEVKAYIPIFQEYDRFLFSGRMYNRFWDMKEAAEQTYNSVKDDPNASMEMKAQAQLEKKNFQATGDVITKAQDHVNSGKELSEDQKRDLFRHINEVTSTENLLTSDIPESLKTFGSEPLDLTETEKAIQQKAEASKTRKEMVKEEREKQYGEFTPEETYMSTRDSDEKVDYYAEKFKGMSIEQYTKEIETLISKGVISSTKKDKSKTAVRIIERLQK